MRERLSPQRLLMENVFDPSPAQELLKATASTLARVFPSVLILSDGRGSHMLFGFAAPQQLDSLKQKLASSTGAVSGPGMRMVKWASGAIKQYDAPPGIAVFTDDRAPIEGMTRRAFLEYYRKMDSAAK